MMKKSWKKLFLIFLGNALILSVVVSGFLSFSLPLSPLTGQQVSLFLNHLIGILPIISGFSVFLFFCAFLYLRNWTQAGSFVLRCFTDSAPVFSRSALKTKQKALFDLAHTKNPYLKNIRPQLNSFLQGVAFETFPSSSKVQMKLENTNKIHITDKAQKNQDRENRPTALTFSDIVTQALYQSQKSYPSLKITTDLQADIELPFYAPAMFQALWELIKNAQQVSPPHEAVNIRTYHKGHNWFCCEVEDKGPGMNRALMEKASRLYWTNKKDSTGLGLPLVQSALSRIGGILKLNSSAKGGLKVLLFIPKDYLFPVHHSRIGSEPGSPLSPNSFSKDIKQDQREKENEAGFTPPP